MILELVEQIVRWAGATGLAVFLIIAFGGILSQRKRALGRTEGKMAWLLRWPSFLLFIALDAAVCVLLWKPLPLEFTAVLRWVFIITGFILYFGGITFYIWGRFTLGNMFAGSTGISVQLYAGHKLVTRGPFSVVRHPLYLAMMITAFGALLMYQNWATVFLFLLNCAALPFRALKEESALAKEFGEEWTDYRRRVPAFIPGLRPLKKSQANEKH